MFTILLSTPHGWTDNLGQHEATANEWPTEVAANEAIKELQGVGFPADRDSWKVVNTEDLDNYSLVS